MQIGNGIFSGAITDKVDPELLKLTDDILLSSALYAIACNQRNDVIPLKMSNNNDCKIYIKYDMSPTKDYLKASIQVSLTAMRTLTAQIQYAYDFQMENQQSTSDSSTIREFFSHLTEYTNSKIHEIIQLSTEVATSTNPIGFIKSTIDDVDTKISNGCEELHNVEDK